MKGTEGSKLMCFDGFVNISCIVEGRCRISWGAVMKGVVGSARLWMRVMLRSRADRVWFVMSWSSSWCTSAPHTAVFHPCSRQRWALVIFSNIPAPEIFSSSERERDSHLTEALVLHLSSSSCICSSLWAFIDCFSADLDCCTATYVWIDLSWRQIFITDAVEMFIYKHIIKKLIWRLPYVRFKCSYTSYNKIFIWVLIY